MEINTSTTNCTFCGKENSAYTCPRCNSHYCSVDCYKDKNHINCSEDFYHDWVTVYSKQLVNSPDTKRKMIASLKRLKEQEEKELDSDDDNEELSLEDRMVDLDLSKDVEASVLWERLTDTEKEEFKNQVKSGEAIKWIEIWQPWWIVQEEIKLVEEIQEMPPPKIKQKIPEVKKHIPPLSKLTSRPPADCVKNNVINVLTSYVYTVRSYNGEHHAHALDSIELLMELSHYLWESRNFGTVGEAIHTVLQQKQQDSKGELTTSLCQTQLDVLEDVTMILNGPNERNRANYVLAALTDTLNLLQAAIQLREKQKCKNSKYLHSTKKLPVIAKKVEYLLSWSVENTKTLKETCCDVKLESADIAENAISLETAKKNSNQIVKNKKLIEEI